MYNQIKNIFKNKIIDNPTSINQNDYYYFYKDNSCQEYFGIKKDITNNEYQMLKTIFVRKNIYSTDAQEIYEYLFDNGKYPFNQETSFIIYSVSDDDELTTNSLIQDIYKNVRIIKYLNYNIAFGIFDSTLEEMFIAFSNDVGYEIKLHHGIKINKLTRGLDVLSYINYYDKELQNYVYSSVREVIIKLNNQNHSLLRFIKYQIINQLKSLPNIEDIIDAMLKNNLNVSLTSKLLYMHRSSLLNRLEQIEKATSLNIQNFLDAYAMKIILDYEYND